MPDKACYQSTVAAGLYFSGNDAAAWDFHISWAHRAPENRSKIHEHSSENSSSEESARFCPGDAMGL